jgi:cytidine deaminase
MTTWEKLLSYSHCRYSGQRRACIVQSVSGKLYPGVRIENASFPLSITEFQAALFGCLSEGEVPQLFYLPPGSRVADIPETFIQTFNLEVKQVSDSPEIIPESALIQNHTDIKKTLLQLQKNCKIEESKFPVSCLLETEDGQWISGVNIEFSDWQIGLCAERTAIAKAISYGFRKFNSIHIHAQKGQFISPCGACRQVLVEHMAYKTIVLYHPDNTISEHTPAELLPAFFSGNSIT